VPRVDLEAERLLGRLTEAAEHSLGHIDATPATLTDEMGVRTPGELVRDGAVPEVGVHDDTQALELLEVPVHGREMHIGGAGLDGSRQFLGAVMTATVEEDLQERPPGRRRTSAGRPDELQDGVHRRDAGLARGCRCVLHTHGQRLEVFLSSSC
jgi:hypothetical protein